MKSTVKTFILTGSLTIAAAGADAAAQETAQSDSIAGYEMLDELVVTGERPVLQSDGAKTTYNVADDPGASASNVLDMLKKVPLVSVDGDGKVKLKGQSNFKFQINGLDNPMLSQYADQVLKAMPATSVMKIEVITEPGAREDAEGGAGIINIVLLRRQEQNGLMGNINANASNRDAGIGAYAITKRDKVTLSANVNYQRSIDATVSTSETDTRYYGGIADGSMLSLTRQSQKFSYTGGNIDFSWEPDANNLLSAGGNINYVDACIDALDTETTRYDPSGATIWKFTQGGNGMFKMISASANASYRHNFAPQGHNLILSYLFNFGRQLIDIARTTDHDSGYPVDEKFTSDKNVNFNREHTVQLDYSNSFGSEHHLLESGVKGIFRRNASSSEYYAGESWPPAFMPDRLTSMDQPQDIYAAYASYTGTFGNLTTLAGVRYEHSRLGIDFHHGEGQDFYRNLDDLVPNAAITWNFSPGSNMRAAYQMRISRPGISQVNPYAIETSPFEARQGNPDLESEKINKISLSYTNFGRIMGGSVTLEHSITDNAISSYSFTRTTTEGHLQTVSSFANIGKTRATTLSGFLNWNIISHMSANISGTLAYNYLSAPQEHFKNHGWSGSVNASWNYTLADVWKFNAWGGWSSRSISLQGRDSGWYYYGLTASRDLLADRSLTIAINVHNFLTPRQTFRGYFDTGVSHTDTSWTNRSNWRAGLSLSWKFGNLQAQVKKTGANLGNDDTSAASNKGQNSF